LSKIDKQGKIKNMFEYIRAKERLGKTYEEIGAAVGVDKQSVCNIFKRRRTVSLKKLIEIGDFLGLPDQIAFETWKRVNNIHQHGETSKTSQKQKKTS
jgi:transcriptional regulator with XRE-family HTH domain